MNEVYFSKVMEYIGVFLHPALTHEGMPLKLQRIVHYLEYRIKYKSNNNNNNNNKKVGVGEYKHKRKYAAKPTEQPCLASNPGEKKNGVE